MKTSVPHYRRCNIVFSAVFTCVLHLFFLSYHGSAVGEERASSNECGVLCLHSIKNQFSAPPMERYGKFKEQFGIIGRNGVSLNELAKCCDGYKLCSKAIHTKDLNVLKEVSTKYGVIAHLLPSHFVIVRNVSAIAVDIAEPPNLLQMKRSEFLEQWSGDLLIISDHEIALQHSFEVWKWIASVSAVVLFIGITYFGVFRNSKWSLHRLSSATRFSVALFFVIPSAVGCDSKLAKQKSEFGDELDPITGAVFRTRAERMKEHYKLNTVIPTDEPVSRSARSREASGSSGIRVSCFPVGSSQEHVC